MRVRQIPWHTLLVAFWALLTACSSRPDHGGLDVSTSNLTTTAHASPSASLVERQLIRSATLSVYVDDVARRRAQAEQLAVGAGGYVQTLDTSHSDTGHTVHLVLRVPKDSLDAQLEKLRALGKIQNEHQGVEDVTRVYQDTDARLRNLRRTEERMLSLMTTSSAALADVVAVERELSRVRGDIESMEADFRGLHERIALSTIDLTLYQNPDELAPPSIWSPWKKLFGELASIVGSSVRALIATSAALVRATLYALPWLPVLAAAWLVLRKLRARWEAWRRKPPQR